MRILFASCLLGCALACAEERGAPDGGLLDATASDTGADSGAGALPSAVELLPPARYDCTATGPFDPPLRPHPWGCERDVSCTGKLIAAHRMGVPFAPENSLSALRASILLGVDMVETDIRMTSDGHVVLMHDDDIDRTVEGSGPVDGMTLAQLQALPLKVSASRVGDYSCDRVPTLDDVFALSRGKIIVELEVKDAEAGAEAARYLRDHGLYDDAFLLCSERECGVARAAVPDVPIMPLARDAGRVSDLLALSPGPILVHIELTDAFLAPEVLDAIHAGGARVYGNAFRNADPLALLNHDLSVYQDNLDRGLDVMQTEFPHWALMAVGRLEAP